MIIGLIPNTTKDQIVDICKTFARKLKDNGFEFLISASLLGLNKELTNEIDENKFQNHDVLTSKSDMLLSIGGDGTLLNSAFEARKFGTPIIGVNLGKLGFLAEFDVHRIDDLILAIKYKQYYIEERIALEAKCKTSDEELFAINDLVIEKGRWPKMIELTIQVDNDYVSTFSADGLIIATPTGSTGYSLSTGGPIVNPKAQVITLSPISPHTLTMRPLVLSSEQKITIIANSPHTSVQINCDGQRVYYYQPPVVVEIVKSKTPVRLVHTKDTNYFEILRKKLLWGLDVRNSDNK